MGNAEWLRQHGWTLEAHVHQDKSWWSHPEHGTKRYYNALKLCPPMPVPLEKFLADWDDSCSAV